MTNMKFLCDDPMHVESHVNCSSNVDMANMANMANGLIYVCDPSVLCTR